MTGESGTRESRIVVGLMSGTSLDGISAVVVRFDKRNTSISADLLAFSHRPYTHDERSRLERAMHDGSARDYCRLHVDVGSWFADAAVRVIAESGVARADIACVASHGQTLWHEPGHSTWQIGDAATIAERTGCDVYADFRSRDVAAGGQGAPLVPIADLALFAHDTEWRALQNIGGIGNVTVVPPLSAGERQADGVRAFDTGPGMVLIDTITRLLRPELPFDVDGALAARGNAIDSVVDESLRLPYFRVSPPKSTGRELFTRAFAEHFILLCRRHKATDEDVIATAVRFTARSIAHQYREFLPEPIAEVLVSGGGARNPVLVSAIRSELESTGADRGVKAPSVTLFSKRFFDGEAKEAVAFALLGYFACMGLPGNVPRATGARGPRLLGALVRA